MEVVWIKDSSKKANVLIDSICTYEYLAHKITEQLENYPQFSNLKGLKAFKIFKQTDKGNLAIEKYDLKDIRVFSRLVHENRWTGAHIVRIVISVPVSGARRHHSKLLSAMQIVSAMPSSQK